jgi:zinc protease
MNRVRKLRSVLVLAIAIWLRPSATFLQTDVIQADVKVPVLELQDTRLPNGLRVILAPDHSAPVYAINVTYNVGSRNERPGRTGFAHLFEHMMFEGSQNVGKGEHFILVLNNGGGMNGTTNEDRTMYFEELPKNQLDLGLYLEADRMRALNITQANFENQRQTVEEERRPELCEWPVETPTKIETSRERAAGIERLVFIRADSI